MNKYIKTLKENLKGYYGTVISQRQYLDDAKKKYIGSMLSDYENQYHNNKADAFKKFCRMVDADFGMIKKAISKASYIDAKKTESPIFKMFTNSTVELTDYEIRTYLDKAILEHDFTMMRAIKTYADKHKLSIIIPSPDDVLDGYHEFYDSAMNIAREIDADETTVPNAYIDSFADEEFGSQLFNVIGSADFPNQDLSDAFAHRYDEKYHLYSQEPENTGFVFGFTPIN